MRNQPHPEWRHAIPLTVDYMEFKIFDFLLYKGLISEDRHLEDAVLFDWEAVLLKNVDNRRIEKRNGTPVYFRPLPASAFDDAHKSGTEDFSDCVLWCIDSFYNDLFGGIHNDPNQVKLKDMAEHLLSSATPTLFIY